MTPTVRTRLAMTAARALLRAGAALVPSHRRADWAAEWGAELWVLHARGTPAHRLLAFGAGGLRHALWERNGEEGMMGGLANDTRLALRRLGRSPGFTLVTVAVLALGIGANASLFSATEAALLRQPAIPEIERLVLVDMLLQSSRDTPHDTMTWSYPKFELAREQLRSLEAVAGYASGRLTLTGAGDAARVAVEYVTPAYFPLLGVRPAAGRLLTPDEEAPADAPVAILSHGMWAGRFGADPGVVGGVMVLEGKPFQVVGVAQPGFAGVTGSAELWVPMAGITTLRGPRRLRQEWAHWLHALGRLQPGVSLTDARADAATVGAALTERFPDPSGGGTHGVTMVRYLDARVNPVARVAVASVGAAALLFLLIACANVAALMLARASARRSDVAVRATLGAGRGRLVREHLLESMLLAGAGGALGLAVAFAAEGAVAAAVRHALDTSGTRGLQYLDPAALSLDREVLLGALLLVLATGLLSGLLPAWSAAHASPGDDLRRASAGGLGARGGGAAEGVRSWLVSGQLALTVVLLAGAGLMASSLGRLAGVRTGFAHGSVLTLSFERGPGPSADENRAWMSAMLERLSALPGVEAASAATCPPLAGRCEIVGLRQVDDEPPKDWSEVTGVLAYTVSAEHFATIGTRLVSGRGFGADDRPGDAPVVLVNETAARELFGGSALGRRLSITHELTEDAMATVVGVVGDVRYAGLDESVMPAVYLSERQAPMAYGTLFVRTAGAPYALLDAVRREAAALDGNTPLFGVSTLEERRAEQTARTRVVLGLLAAFGVSGLLLAVLGLYGLVSHAVARRTREVGLRMALGAGTPGVLGLMVYRPALLALAGAAAGIAAAAWATPYLAQLLYATDATDPVVLAATATLLLAVAIVAAVVPARRAARIAPASALRSD